MYDPDTHAEVVVELNSDTRVLARFCIESGDSIKLYNDDDLAEFNHALLSAADRQRVLDAVGLKLVELGAVEVPAEWLNTLL